MLSHTRMGVPYEYTHMGRPIYTRMGQYTHMGQNITMNKNCLRQEKVLSASVLPKLSGMVVFIYSCI